MAGCDFVFHLAANADVRFGTDHPRRDLEQNTIATLQRARGDARQRHQADRLLLDRLGLRRGDRLPDAGGRAVPGADVALRRLQAGRRGADRGVLRGLRLRRAASSASSRSSASATPTATCSTSTSSSATTRRSCGCSATASSASRTSTCRTASTRSCTAIERATAKVNIFNLGTDEYCEVNDSIGWICERARRRRRERDYTGGERGWIGDSPFIFLDCARMRVARLGAEADDPRRHPAHARAICRPTPGCCRRRR